MRHRTVKTDRRDARALAEACRLGAYRPAHWLSDGQRHVRGRLAVRDALVRTRTRYISLVRALLRQRGWRVPTGTAEGFSRRVAALPLPGQLLSEVAPLLAVMRQVNQQLAYSHERIAALTQTDERVRRLQSVPNVGPVTAAAFVATLDDAQRFHRAHEVEAYLGLVPRELSSGEGRPDRSPARQGHRRGGPGAPARRHPLRPAARRDGVRARPAPDSRAHAGRLTSPRPWAVLGASRPAPGGGGAGRARRGRPPAPRHSPRR